MQQRNGSFYPNLMQRIKRAGLWISIDVAVILASYTAAYSMRSLISPLDYAVHLPSILIAMMTTVVFLYVVGVYHRIWSQTSGHGISVILSAILSTLFVMVTADLVIEPRPLPLSIVIMGNVLSFGGLITVRYRSRLVSGLWWRWQVIWNSDFPESRERVLIVGAGEAGQMVAWRIKHRSSGIDNKYQVVGFIDDDLGKQGMYVESCLVMGTRQDIPRIAEEEKIELIIMAIHKISGADVREILMHCESTGARIKVIPDMFGLLKMRQGSMSLRDVGPEDLIGRSTISRHDAVNLSPVIGKVVMVTGAAGSIGSELSRQLVSYDPVKLILLDNNESALHDLSIDLQARHPDLALISVLADVTLADTVARVFERHNPQIVFHAAAYKHVPLLELHPKEAIRVNVMGTRYMLELAKKYEVERFVLISTDKAVNPSSVMGASKRLCELLFHSFCQDEECPSTLFTAVRFGNVLGSRGSVVPTFNRQISAGGPVTVTHPEMTRYFMSIPEAVNLVIHAACLTEGDDIFVLQMGEVVRILDIAERMIRLRGLRPYEDVDIQFVGIRPGEKLHEKLYDDVEEPVDTAHPYITKLSNWVHVSKKNVFFEMVDDLYHHSLNGDLDIANELTELISTDQCSLE